MARYDYDSWGNSEGASGSEASQPYRWSTKRLHVDSGLYDYGFRFYNPSLHQWIGRDPIGEAGGVNLYAFVGNSPTNAVDTDDQTLGSIGFYTPVNAEGLV